MRTSRQTRLLIGLVSLGFLAGLVWLVATRPASAPEPTYQGKSLTVWFMEYAFSSNPPPPRMSPLSSSVLPEGQTILLLSTATGMVARVLAPTNAIARAAWIEVTTLPARDLPREALRALDSNAVPYLAAQLRGIPFEQTYSRVFTNLPAPLQKRLPNPRVKRFVRIQALSALSMLGDSAKGAIPAVLRLLKERDRSVRFAVIEALRQLHAGRGDITKSLLELGARRRYPDVLEIAAQTDWNGEEMAKLFVVILKSPDPALRWQAMALLERCGTDAVLEVEAVLNALNDSDPEVRYLAARTVERTGIGSPEVMAALQRSLADGNVMVQTVALRTLSKLAPGTLPEVQVGNEARP